MNRLTMTGQMWITAALLCVVALSVSGCATENEPAAQVRSFLASERGPEDALPEKYPEMDGIDGVSSRQVGVQGDIRYFVAAYETAGVCLILVNTTTEVSGSACGSDVRHLWTIGTGVGGAKVVASVDVVPEGWERLGNFLIVNPDATSP